ncbi:MAG: hypothetical protein MUQ25_03810 [Candidatus Aminicenantes bacterium]|nr:hypothetical protein [Candidatus Aminicenantes bacterium]
MDVELKNESVKIFQTKLVEAGGHKAMLEKLLIDKAAEHAAEIESIRKNIDYYAARVVYANKYILTLSKEAAGIAAL